jgi:7-cyano-7-deazaguanine synthase
MSPCDAVVLHSGGMDSSICLGLAAKRFGASRVISLGFTYQQRHFSELQAASAIADHLSVRRLTIDVPILPGWENSSLVQSTIPIDTSQTIPNTFVASRNGLFLMMAAPLVRAVEARYMYIGIMEKEEANSGYPDCSRHYIDLVQSVIQADLQDKDVVVETPLCHLTKDQTLSIASDLGILDYLLEHTISCYEGLPLIGCKVCPACRLRNEGIITFYRERPHLMIPKTYQAIF